MKIESFIYNDLRDFSANTYVAYEDKDAIVIDPGKDYPGIEEFIDKNHLHLNGILLTHGHFDHIGGVKRLADKYHATTYIFFGEDEFLRESKLNLSRGFSKKVEFNDLKIKTFGPNDVLKHLLPYEIKIIYTPYHTSGSSCFYIKEEKVLFSGDSLFRLGLGRTDFPTGDKSLIESSLKKILSLPDDVTVYPGHNGNTTIGFEKANNPYYK